jgi:hypothetical protein
MNVNMLAVVLATVAQFMVGAFWYTALFGKLWGKMHGFDKLSKEVQDAMTKQMGPIYGFQLLVTVMTSFVLAVLISVMPSDWNVYWLATLLWLGFIVPTQASNVFFGGTESRWIVKKIAVLSGGSLASLLTAALVFSLF